MSLLDRLVRRANPDAAAYLKAKERLDKVKSGQALQWADTTLWTLQEGLDGFRATSDRATLLQARTAAFGVLAAVDSLLDRTE